MNSRRLIRILAVVGSLAAAASTAVAQTARTEARPRPATPQGFSVVLVLGDSQSGSSADNVPPAARKALNDMKDFLPYRGYRLLDAQWILGSQRSMSRLRGADNEEYQLTLHGTPMGGRMHVLFQLREPADTPAALASTESTARAAELKAMQARLQDLVMALRERQNARDTDRPSAARLSEEAARLRQQIALLEGATPSPRGRSVIDTSFSMDVGETVVVGTSHVRGGDKALIALLTAVEKKKQ